MDIVTPYSKVISLSIYRGLYSHNLLTWMQCREAMQLGASDPGLDVVFVAAVMNVHLTHAICESIEADETPKERDGKVDEILARLKPAFKKNEKRYAIYKGFVDTYARTKNSG